MASGTVLWFDPTRGFGFIRPLMGPRDVFVHASAVRDCAGGRVFPCDKVEFELVQGGDGRLLAQHVHVIRDEEPGQAVNGSPAPTA